MIMSIVYHLTLYFSIGPYGYCGKFHPMQFLQTMNIDDEYHLIRPQKYLAYHYIAQSL